MPPKPVPTNVVDLDSSDDETDAGARVAPSKSSDKKPIIQNTPQAQNPDSRPPPPATGTEEIELRSFWKAGNYSVGPTKWAPLEGQLEHARVHPKFLHSNATSHKWAFGAIAELLDNAVDEIGNGATFVKVDRIYNAKDNTPALIFVDDGGGMDPESIRKCMSLGYSSKKSNTTIGQYGNGFKTSTMRLGADVIVFSRATSKGHATQSVGLLSYTFLRKTGQDDVIVPMVDFDISKHWAEPIVYSSKDDWSTNLKNILEWSPFESKDELLLQFEDIGAHGTKVIIFNLWLNDEGIYELNFDDNEEDIKLRDEANHGNVHRSDKKKVQELQSHISYRYKFSLREYASMLYLRRFSNFQIILRGKPVEQFNIADELIHPKKVYYKPQLAIKSKEVSVETTIGFIKEAPIPISGFNVYHKNRLIRPFWKVTIDGSSQGNGVVGVLETNFIEPAHDKQDFERSSLFIRLEMRLKQMVAEYWRGHCHLIGYQAYGLKRANPTPPSVGRMVNAPKQVANGHTAIQLSGKGQKEMPRGPSIIGLAANTRPEAQVVGFNAGTSVQEVAYADNSMTDEQICEENIQLFRRCEEHAEKENKLIQTIKDLERQLNDTRNQCVQLSAYLESKRKQKLIQAADHV